MRTRSGNKYKSQDDDAIGRADTLPLSSTTATSSRRKNVVAKKSIKTMPVAKRGNIVEYSDDEQVTDESETENDIDIIAGQGGLNSVGTNETKPSSLEDGTDRSRSSQSATPQPQNPSTAAAPSASCCSRIATCFYYTGLAIFFLGMGVILMLTMKYQLFMAPLNPKSFHTLASQFPALNESIHSLYPAVAFHSSQSQKDTGLVVSVVCIEKTDDTELVKYQKRHFFDNFVRSMALSMASSRQLANISESEIDPKVSSFLSKKEGNVVLFHDIISLVNPETIGTIQRYVDDFDAPFPQAIFLSTIYIPSNEWEKHAQVVLESEIDTLANTQSKLCSIVQSFLKHSAFTGKNINKDLIEPLVGRLTKNIIYDNSLLAGLSS